MSFYLILFVLQCPLTVVPDYKTYTFPNTDKIHLPVDLEAYQTNASLAIQLAHAWMRITKPTHRKNGVKKLLNNTQNGISAVLEPVVKCVTKETMEGLTSCKWPGRYHVVHAEYAQFYLDGAHTKESMEICAQWYRNTNVYVWFHIIKVMRFCMHYGKARVYNIFYIA